MIWDVPKGKFDSAIAKLGVAMGREFGPFIDKLNGPDIYAQGVNLAINRPDLVFIQKLIEQFGIFYSVTELSFALEYKRPRYDLVRRASNHIDLAFAEENAPIDNIGLFGECGWEIVPYCRTLVERHKFRGIIEAQAFLSEVALMAGIRSYVCKNDLTPDWVLQITRTVDLPTVSGLLGERFADLFKKAGIPNLVVGMQGAIGSAQILIGQELEAAARF